MKSRISCFNKTIFKKNLTRFAPAWGLYTIYLLMGLVTLIDSGTDWFASNVCDLVQILVIFTPCYALLCAQLLFGDLYNSRMCNALHALPLRRETWFVTNVTSGFVFHLIPTVIFAVLAALYALLACPAGDWLAAPLWLLGVNLQFMCFFGIAVFSAFCVGNRFAQAVVYGIVNFAAAIVGWMLDTIFVPMYYGIKLNLAPILWFSPVGQMLDQPFCSQNRSYSSGGQLNLGELVLEDNFLYYFIVAAVGIGLIFLALQLYRRRKLECAGDFLAIPAMEPVFLVVYTLIVGCVFHFIADDLFGLYSYVFPYLGLVVGWFTGKMLLERTTRVFQRKSFLRCGVLMAAYTLTLAVAALDPFGIEGWVPETEEVACVTIADGHYQYHDAELTLEDPEDIQRIIAIHEKTLEEHRGKIPEDFAFEQAYAELILKEEPAAMDFSMQITFTYQLKNGATRSRYYNVWMGGEEGQHLKQLFSSPEAVTGYVDMASFLAENSHLCVRDTWHGDETNVYSQADLTSLYEAILADCEAGTMGQNWNFHNSDECLYWLNFDSGLEITVFLNCENTLRWLADYGLDVGAIIEHKAEMYG